MLEQGFLKYIKHKELRVKYYNKSLLAQGIDSETSRKIQIKRVIEGTHHFLGPGFNDRRIADKREADGAYLSSLPKGDLLPPEGVLPVVHWAYRVLSTVASLEVERDHD
jgi:hypothetical protein